MLSFAPTTAQNVTLDVVPTCVGSEEGGSDNSTRWRSRHRYTRGRGGHGQQGLGGAVQPNAGSYRCPHELAEESEELTKQLEGLPCLVRWHERARVEARVALQQAELGERLIDKGQRERAGEIDVRTPRPCVT
jgi:hypothetical protein